MMAGVWGSVGRKMKTMVLEQEQKRKRKHSGEESVEN